MFFYSDTEKSSFNPALAVPYHKQNAVRSYMRHYDNYMFLSFLILKSDNFVEKAQATKEIAICERKLKHWQQHANYDVEEASRKMVKAKKDWQHNGS
jgi:hypothetical protein